MQRPLSLFICAITILFVGLSRSEATEPKITTIPSNGGYVEKAYVSYNDGKMYIDGWLKPHYWGSGKIYFQVDLKGSKGNLIATKIGYAYANGRPQIIEQFGVYFLVSFDVAQTTDVAVVEVRYLNGISKS